MMLHLALINELSQYLSSRSSSALWTPRLINFGKEAILRLKHNIFCNKSPYEKLNKLYLALRKNSSIPIVKNVKSAAIFNLHQPICSQHHTQHYLTGYKEIDSMHPTAAYQ